MATNLVLKVNAQGTMAHLKKIITNFPVTNRKIRQKTAEMVKAQARTNVEEKAIYHAEGQYAGDVYNKWDINHKDEKTTILKNLSPVAEWLEFGTKPHRIPKEGETYMHFDINGVPTTRYSVMHPGAGQAILSPKSPLVHHFIAEAVKTVQASGRIGRNATQEINKLVRGK